MSTQKNAADVVFVTVMLFAITVILTFTFLSEQSWRETCNIDNGTSLCGQVVTVRNGRPILGVIYGDGPQTRDCSLSTIYTPIPTERFGGVRAGDFVHIEYYPSDTCDVRVRTVSVSEYKR